MSVTEKPRRPPPTSSPPRTFDDLDGHRHGVPPKPFPHLSEVALAQLPPQGELPARALPAVPLGGGLRKGHGTLGPAGTRGTASTGSRCRWQRPGHGAIVAKCSLGAQSAGQPLQGARRARGRRKYQEFEVFKSPSSPPEVAFLSVHR